MKRKIIILTILISVLIVLLACKKEPKSIFGKTHRVLIRIVDVAKSIEDNQDVRKKYSEMQQLLVSFHQNLKMIGAMNMEQLTEESKKNHAETQEFYEYLNKILQERNQGFIKDMQRIGSMGLEGQRLRNAFYEAIYLFRNQVMQNLNRNENNANTPSESNRNPERR